ncbi:MAG: rhamnogalacturonate lyase [Prevotella sp.]|nr:rhamnogalacturonate lyase [Prevotella sp.]
MTKSKQIFMLLLLLLLSVTVSAQRVIDNLDRGVVAVKTTGGVFVSWRIQSDEYYDVTYNLYRDGSLVVENLKTSNYTDASGSTSSKYTVAAVINGVVQEQSQPVAVWAQDYMEITPQHPSELKATYVPNDACAADVDGDGTVELLMKYNNSQEMSNSFPVNGWYNEHTLFEVTKLDGSVLWWVNCGPNMGDFQNNEQNIVGYDWDQDGSAEVLMRLEEGSSIHMADGTVYTIGADGKNGTSWTNYRGQGWVSPAGATVAVETGVSSTATVSCSADWVTLSNVDGVVYATAVKNGDPKENPSVTTSARSTTITIVDNGVTKRFGFGQNYYRDGKEISSQYFTHYGKEFLVYCNGKTGQIYDIIDFPCARFESNETDLNAAWGDGYGHRSSKFFYGAPYLDGRNPSIFVGRGIYTRHKFVALDVDKNTHKLSERWRWMNNQKGSPWYGQGYHNYAVADVDWDGRDEIVFGGLVIDDNGMGLSTAGFGHGDAQHHSDFNPYIHGHEGWFCNEDAPSNHYRDLTTAKLYYRLEGGNDDGRAIAGNFCNTVPGAFASSARDSGNPISLVTNEHVAGYSTSGMEQNFNCYWDGDLCEETYNADGTNYDNKPGAIYKYNQGKIKTFEGSLANNWTKATPCFMGDILGDWRHEFVMRTADNKIRIYTTTIETPWRIYSMWYDHQQRNAMVWQMCGYNQPPHTSYFLGEMEGITAAPPALTMKGRTEIANGGTISNDGASVITCETNDMTVSVADGATPYIYIDNTPSLVSGSAPSEATAKEYPITYTYYTHTLTGGAFAGDMRLVKQGDGALTLPDVVQTYTGQTDVWAGTLNFNGTLQNSRLWLNRFAELNSDNGTFAKGIQAEYAAIIRPGGKEAKASTITTDSLILDFGSVVELDIYSNGLKADSIKANVLKIEKKDWTNGPQYLAPVFRINAHPAAGAAAIADGVYCLGTIGEVKGNLGDIIIENLPNQKAVLSLEEGKLMLAVTNYVGVPITWKGDKGTAWDLDETANFVKTETGEEAVFYTGSDVTFNDNATNYNVEIKGNVSPASVTFLNKKQYTVSGDKIIGTPDLLKDSVGVVYLNNVNDMGNTTISGGTLCVASLANSTGTEMGSLGTIDKTITLTGNGTLGISNSITNGQKIICANDNGVINTPSGVTLTQVANIATYKNGALTKTGDGTLITSGALTPSGITLNGGTFTHNGTAYTKTVTLVGNVNISGTGFNSSTFAVADGAKAVFTAINRTTASNTISGGGQITVYSAAEKGSGYYATRTPLQLKLSNFTGTLVADAVYSADGRFTFDTSTGSDKFTLNIPANRYVQNSGKTMRIGQLAGTGTLGGTCSFTQSGGTAVNTWNVGNDNDFTFGGSVVDNANFTKMGSGTMTASAAWSTTGSVKVSEGTLRFKAKATLGTGALTVAEGAVLAGLSNTASGTSKNSPITNSSITVNGTLWPSSQETSVSSSYLCIGDKTVDFSSTSRLKVGLKKCSTGSVVYNTCLIGDGSKATINFADGATLEAYAPTYTPTFVNEEVTDSFKVLADIPNVNVAGKLNYELPTLPMHYYWKNRWDSTLLAKTGCLYVGYIELIGDANRDNQVTMADANMVVNYFLGGTAEGISLPHADVNGDGQITMADANAIVNIFLGQ